VPSNNLTDRAIKALRPADRQIDYSDKGLPGFLLRVCPGGAKTFQVFYRHHRRQRRYTLGRYPTLTLTAARTRQMAKIALADAIHGKDPGAIRKSEREAETFARLAAAYMERHAKKFKKTWRQDEWMIDTYLNPVWGPRKLKDITRRDVRDVVVRIADHAPIMANRVLALVKRMFNFALDDEWVDANPCYRLARPSKEHQRDRVLTEDEIHALWTALDEEPAPVAALLRFQLLTAQRVSEVRQMRRTDLDVNGAWWTIPSEFAKNGHAHRVPLSSQALDIVKQRLAATTGSWLFTAAKDASLPLSYGTIHTAVRRIRKNAGLQDWGSHDLRRTVVSLLSAQGTSRTILKKILNHAEREVISTYDRYSYDPEKRAALDAWARRVEAILTGKTSSSVVQFMRA
jgi:integrase